MTASEYIVTADVTTTWDVHVRAASGDEAERIVHDYFSGTDRAHAAAGHVVRVEQVDISTVEIALADRATTARLGE